MKFFNVDQHISVIADLKHLWGHLGHSIDDICLSGHAAVMGRKRDSIPMLDGDKWCGFVQRKDYDKFSEMFPDLDEKYDGFVCCYPPLFSYLYKNFKKPIIVDIPIRYEYPCQSSKEDWEQFNGYLQEGVDSRRIFLIANSEYDKRYTELFLKRPVEYIPSICMYTGAKYRPVRNEFLYYSTKSFAEFSGSNFKRKHDTLPFGHTWQEIADYSGVVHFPYNVSTMSTFEHYSANIPIFCPSLDFLLELYKHKKTYGVLEQISWAGTFGRPSGSVVDVPEGELDPNDFENIDSVRWWMQFSDYYNKDSMPHIIHFNSFDELFDKAMHLDLDAVSSDMQVNNKQRLEYALTKWDTLLGKIEGRK
jgi:hypothetical protein